MYKKILIPTDGSEHSKRAAKHAKWIANCSGADILVLNVFETSSLNPIRSMELENDLKKLWMKEAQDSLNDVIELLNPDVSRINVTTQIKEGRPAETILKTIIKEDVDLVVIGSSGKNTLGRLFIGSVAEKVVRSAKSPVLIVH
jgi:nucleotide-binding universal stress UspA family protein